MLRSLIGIALGFLYCLLTASTPHLPPEGVYGVGDFAVESIIVTPGRGFCYRGTLLNFGTEQQQWRKIPCTLYLKQNKERPTADKDYQIHGTLVQKKRGVYRLKPDTKKRWQPIASSKRLAEDRFQAKKQGATKIAKLYPNPDVARFLCALLLGMEADPLLRCCFNRLGLVHLLAISGFHFGLLAALGALLLKRFFSYRLLAVTMLALLTLYLLLLGVSPSILRAYCAAFAAFSALALQRQYRSLNALGLGLLATLLYQPLWITHLGFQLSFLTTGALLLLFTPIDTLLKKRLSSLLPEEPALCSTARLLALIGSGWMRKSVALSMAVASVCIPYCLHTFHHFPLITVATNLLLPALTALALIFFVVSCGVQALDEHLGLLFHKCNQALLDAMLQTTFLLPRPLQGVIYCPHFSTSLLILLLFAALFMGIALNKKNS